MAAVLHIVGQPDWSRALDVIRGQVAAGDTVTVAVTGPGLPRAPARGDRTSCSRRPLV